ncbi:MAG: AraC family transcriptional regulator [Pseudomonadota bacterium]
MKNTAHLSPRRYELLRTPHMLARLTFYPAGGVLSAHAHNTDQYSILMLGGFAEATRKGEEDLCGIRAGFKSAGLVHQNRFGPDGALILAIDRLPIEMEETCWRWRSAHGHSAMRQLVWHLLTVDVRGVNAPEAEIQDILDELTALLFYTPDAKANGAHRVASWLRRIREEIDDAPRDASLKKLAHEAGVHHVHLSRSFAKVYGQPLSLYRRRAMAMRAASALAAWGRTPVQAAGEAGFADQSHMTRVMQSEIGLTPSRLRRMFAAAS